MFHNLKRSGEPSNIHRHVFWCTHQASKRGTGPCCVSRTHQWRYLPRQVTRVRGQHELIARRCDHNQRKNRRNYIQRPSVCKGLHDTIRQRSRHTTVRSNVFHEARREAKAPCERPSAKENKALELHCKVLFLYINNDAYVSSVV